MVLPVLNPVEKKANLFVTDEEVGMIWNALDRWTPRWKVMVGFAAFRGMRCGEICAINLYDFQDDNFNQINIILEKSNIQDKFPLIKGFSDIVKHYVHNNLHTFKDGFLFPYYSTSAKKKYMSVESAGTMLAKLRKELAKQHPQFLDKKRYLKAEYRILDAIHQKKGFTNLHLSHHAIKKARTLVKKKGWVAGEELTPLGQEALANPEYFYKYRIGWHSLRRWFETKLWEGGFNPEQIAFIMRYKSPKVVYTYLDSYKIWKNEKNHLEETFNNLFVKFNRQPAGQTTLHGFG